MNQDNVEHFAIKQWIGDQAVKIAVAEEKLTKIESTLSNYEKNHFPTIDRKFDAVEKRFDRVERKLDFYAGGIVVAIFALELILRFL